MATASRMIREKHSQDPKFSFLFDTSSPAHAYYQRKLASLYSTKPIMPLMAAAPSAPAPRSLHPPPAGAPPPPPPMQLFQPHLVHQQVRLACGGPDLIACTLPCAAADRRTRNHLRVSLTHFQSSYLFAVRGASAAASPAAIALASAIGRGADGAENAGWLAGHGADAA